MQANAVVFTRPGAVTFQNVTCPDPTPDDVVINVMHSWISNGTEGSYLRGERIDGDTPRGDDDPWPFPICAGYQKVGIADWVGKNVENIRKGDLVFAAMSKVEGLFDDRAGHISPAVTHQGGVWKLPAGSDPIAYSGLVLTQVGYNCGVRPQVAAGSTAIVVGDGLVGQWTAQTLLWRGINVIMVGRHADRLGYAGKNSDCICINAKQIDWIERIKELCPEGADIGVDTVGDMEIINAFFDVLRRDGHLVSAGFYGQQDAVRLQPLRYKELCIHLPSGATRPRMDRTIELIRDGDLQTRSMISHRFPAQEAARAWNLITTKSEPVLGVVLDWEQTA